MNKFLKIGFTGACFGLIGFAGYYIQENLPELQDRIKISYTTNRFIADQLQKQALIDFKIQNALVHMISMGEDPTVKTSLYDFPINERKQITRIIEALYYESRGEEVTGIVAVAKNLRSRVGRDNFGNTFNAVITQHNQYEYLEHKKWRYKNINKNMSKYRLIKKIALYTYQDRLDDLKKVLDYDWRVVEKMKNPLFYATTKLVKSGKSKFFNNMYKGSRKGQVKRYIIGNHTFFDVLPSTKLASLTN